MNFSVLLWQHLLSPFWSFVCTPIQNELLCCVQHGSCNRLDIFFVHVGYNSICICFGDSHASFCILCVLVFLCTFLPASNSSDSLVASIFSFCTSTLFIQHIVCSLVALFVSLLAVSFLIISGIISSLYCLWIALWGFCLFLCDLNHSLWALGNPSIPQHFHSIPLLVCSAA